MTVAYFGIVSLVVLNIYTKYMYPVFKAEAKNGKFNLLDRPRFDEWVKSLNGMYELIVRKPKKPRSTQENNYYWGVIIKIVSDATGAWPDDVHHEFKKQFLRVGGSIFPVLKSTTELSTVEAEEFYSKCRMFAAQELGCYIPLPNEIEI